MILLGLCTGVGDIAQSHRTWQLSALSPSRKKASQSLVHGIISGVRPQVNLPVTTAGIFDVCPATAGDHDTESERQLIANASTIRSWYLPILRAACMYMIMKKRAETNSVSDAHLLRYSLIPFLLAPSRTNFVHRSGPVITRKINSFLLFLHLFGGL